MSLIIDCRYNRLLTIKGYSNSATKAYMEPREQHFLCIIPGNNTSLLGALLREAKRANLKVGRISTSNSSLEISNGDQVNRGDILVEQVATSRIDVDTVIRDLTSVGRAVKCSVQSSQDITVSSAHLIRPLSFCLVFFTMIFLLRFRDIL